MVLSKYKLFRYSKFSLDKIEQLTEARASSLTKIASFLFP